MAKKPKKQRRKDTDNGSRTADRPQRHATVEPGLLYAGLGLLVVAIFASGMLVWQHFTAGSLPGCGPGSACAQATGSVWGRVPLIDWPISFVGLAYFIGLAAAWITVGRTGFGVLPWIVRLGAALSILYIGVMLVGGMLCPYCVASHVANLAFLVVLETARSNQGGAPASPLLSVPVQRLGIGFVAVSVVLGGWQLQFSQRIEARAEQDLEESTAAMIADASDNQRESADRGGSGFTGRYLYGPEQAPIRLVMFTNYQCIDCQRIEAEVERLLASRSDMSLSIKHYPMSMDCNRYIPRDMHPNSCWAARAVEAAGILGGNERYWQMHRWVFHRKGSFTQAELRAGLQQLGWTNPDEFIRVMMSDQTLHLVQQDIDEAKSLGLHFTPMIFLNGVELRGWTAVNALTRAVTRLASTNPQPVAVDEQPASAFEKFITDWRENNIRSMGRIDGARTLGPANARLRIVVFGDYEEERVAETDARLRQLIADHPSARYTFRHYPVNEACNPGSTRTIYEHTCWAHRAAEATAIIYGPDGFWKMHDWLLANQTSFNDNALRAAAPSLGFDAEAIIELMPSSQVAAALKLDTDEALVQRIRGVPMVFVNERWLPRWNLDGYDVLATIIEEAGR